MNSHKHKFKVAAWCGDQVTFSCSCGEKRERKMDREERRRAPSLRLRPRREDDVHHVWHDFMRRFMEKDGGWRYGGYDLMERAGRWAEKFPDDVRIVRCDDASHAGSDLVLIEHRAKNDYMGTTAVFIPQCAGGSPAQFFLYPDHLDDLLRALREIQRAAVPVKKRQRAAEAESRRWWAARPIPKLREAKP